MSRSEGGRTRGGGGRGVKYRPRKYRAGVMKLINKVRKLHYRRYIR